MAVFEMIYINNTFEREIWAIFWIEKKEILNLTNSKKLLKISHTTQPSKIAEEKLYHILKLIESILSGIYFIYFEQLILD